MFFLSVISCALECAVRMTHSWLTGLVASTGLLRAARVSQVRNSQLCASLVRITESEAEGDSLHTAARMYVCLSL